MSDYNFLLKLKYHNKNEPEEQYQKEFLEVLNLPIFEYNIVKNKMDILFNKYQIYFLDCIEILKINNEFPFALTDIMAFQILFSWDNLFETHKFLGEINQKKEVIKSNNNSLLLHLQKQFK